MAVMLALPWLAVTFVNGDAGMAVCFLLFSLFGIVYPMKMGKAICIAGDGQIFFYKSQNPNYSHSIISLERTQLR